MEQYTSSDVRSARQHSEFHRYRIALITRWSDGPHKESALASARAALAREIRYCVERQSDLPE